MKKVIAETLNTMSWLTVAYVFRWIVADSLLQACAQISMMSIAISCLHQVPVLLAGKNRSDLTPRVAVAMILNTAVIWGVVWSAMYLQLVTLTVGFIWQGLLLTFCIQLVGITTPANRRNIDSRSPHHDR